MEPGRRPQILAAPQRRSSKFRGFQRFAGSNALSPLAGPFSRRQGAPDTGDTERGASSKLAAKSLVSARSGWDGWTGPLPETLIVTMACEPLITPGRSFALVRDQGVAGSNPVSPTIKSPGVSRSSVETPGLFLFPFTAVAGRERVPGFNGPMATKDALLSDVLRLPSEERAEVAHKLLLSLEEGPEDPEA